MTKDEAKQLAVIREQVACMQQQLTDFTDETKPILKALNGPDGWFVRMETRVSNLEGSHHRTTVIFGGLWGLFVVIIGALVGDTRNQFAQLSALIKR